MTNWFTFRYWRFRFWWRWQTQAALQRLVSQEHVKGQNK